MEAPSEWVSRKRGPRARLPAELARRGLSSERSDTGRGAVCRMPLEASDLPGRPEGRAPHSRRQPSGRRRRRSRRGGSSSGPAAPSGREPARRRSRGRCSSSSRPHGRTASPAEERPSRVRSSGSSRGRWPRTPPQSSRRDPPPVPSWRSRSRRRTRGPACWERRVPGRAGRRRGSVESRRAGRHGGLGEDQGSTAVRSRGPTGPGRADPRKGSRRRRTSDGAVSFPGVSPRACRQDGGSEVPRASGIVSAR